MSSEELHGKGKRGGNAIRGGCRVCRRRRRGIGFRISSS